MKFPSILNKIRAVALSSLLVLCVWLGVTYNAQAAMRNPVVPTVDNSERIQAISTCLPKQLTIQNRDVGNRIARAFSEMNNDQLQRIFDLTDTPKLSEAEIEFKNCLQQKGFTPQAALQNS